MNSLQRRNQLLRYLSSHKISMYVNEPIPIKGERNEDLPQLPLMKSSLTRKRSKIKRRQYSEVHLTTYSLPSGTFCSNRGNVLEINRQALFTPLYRCLHISCVNSSKGTIALLNKSGFVNQEKSTRKVYLFDRESAASSLSRLQRKFSNQDVHPSDRQEYSSRVIDLLNRAKEMNIQAKSVRRVVDNKPQKQFRTVGESFANEDDVANEECLAPADDSTQTPESSYREVLYNIFTSVLNKRAKPKSKFILSNSTIKNPDAATKEKSALYKQLTKFDLLKVNAKKLDSSLPVNRGKATSKNYLSSTSERIGEETLSAISKGNPFSRNSGINDSGNTQDLWDQNYNKNYLKHSKNTNRLIRSKTDEYIKNKYNFQHRGDPAIKNEFFPSANSNDLLRNSSMTNNSQISSNYFKRNRRRETVNTIRSLSPEISTRSDFTSKTCYSASSSHQEAFTRFYKKLHPKGYVDPEHSNKTISSSLPKEIIHNIVSYTKSYSLPNIKQRSSSKINVKESAQKLKKPKASLSSTTLKTQSGTSKKPISGKRVLHEIHRSSGRSTQGTRQMLNNKFSEGQLCSDVIMNNTTASQTIMKNIKNNVAKTLEGSAFCKMTNRLLSNIQKSGSWSSGWWENSNLGSRFSPTSESKVQDSSISHL